MDAVQRVVVLAGEPVAPINPYLHGHFAEHLGELVYQGIFVPHTSSIANTAGIRTDVVDALKPLGIPILRWPGGCFADDYHWRDGIGPVEQRPMRINTHWGMAEEPNTFGTHEFMAFCRAIGAEPYFAGNLGSGTPAELRAWVEYCNFGGHSTLANERRANGANDPFNIRWWGVGNENWGCGGNMSPEAYAEAFFRFRNFVFAYPNTEDRNGERTRVEAVACGPNGGDWAWTRRFFESAKNGHTHNRLGSVQGFAAHYYCGTAGTATEYTEDQWLELLAKATAVDGIISGHRAIMDEYDPDRKIKLLLDEWGAWHPVETGKPKGGLYQQNTIRDACVAALSLDIFHGHADKLHMANIAQLINVLQALLLVSDEGCIKTPTYHVFDLYRPHKGANAVRLLSAAESISDGGVSKEACRRQYIDRRGTALRAVQGSASLSGPDNRTLCVTLVNSHPTQPVEVEIDLHGTARLADAELITLAAPDADIRAHNTFAAPDRVRPSAPTRVTAANGECAPRVTLPPASVSRLLGELQ
jgi:alpha-N-arabinofuranosidase